MIKAARYKPITWGLKDLGGDLSKLGLKGSPTSVELKPIKVPFAIL